MKLKDRLKINELSILLKKLEKDNKSDERYIEMIKIKAEIAE